MFSADEFVKPFIDGNWLSIAILLYLLKATASAFQINVLRKIYTVLAQAYHFVRPGTKINNEKEPQS